MERSRVQSRSGGRISDHGQLFFPHPFQLLKGQIAGYSLKPVLNWANVSSPEHTSDTSTNYDSFLN